MCVCMPCESDGDANFITQGTPQADDVEVFSAQKAT